MKRKGFLFIEMVIVTGLISFIVLPLIMLTNKNLSKINYITEEYEYRKLEINLEKIFQKILKEDSEELTSYSLTKEKNGDFILKKGDKKITTLRNIKLRNNPTLSVEKNEIISDEIKKKYLFIFKLKNKQKIRKKVLII